MNHFARMTVYLAFFGLLSLIPTSALGGEDECEWWSRGILAQPSTDPAVDNRFTLFQVTAKNCHLIATVSFYQTEGHNPATQVIEGKRTDDGKFWPDVLLEVRDDKTGTWLGVVAAPVKGTPDKVTIRPNESYDEMRVMLDPFKAFVGKQKFGRLILKTGETAIFELKDI